MSDSEATPTHGRTRVSGRNVRPVRSPCAAERSWSRMVGGVPHRWEEHGTMGQPVVLVHGLPTNPRVWRYVLPRISTGRLFAWEMVGFGRSIPAGAGRDLSVAAQAEYLYAWMRAMRLDRAVLVGHDMGGGVVQRLVKAHPEMCAGVVLVDTVAFDNWPIPTVRVARALRWLLPHLPNTGVRAIFDMALNALGHDDPHVAAESRRLFWAPYASFGAGAGLARQLASLDNAQTRDVSPAMHSLGVPSRVVWGARDPLGMDSGERLARVLEAPLDVLPAACHFTPEDHPEVVASAITAVLHAASPHELLTALPSLDQRPSDPR
ncbi:MAG: alpha/beta fold hydrolase [Myxococcota bacterium]